MDPAGPAVKFVNLEYFFRLLYDLLHGSAKVSGATSFSYAGLFAFLSHLWLFITILAFLFTLAAIGVLVYANTRIAQIREQEKPKYATKSPDVVHAQVEHSRWAYIQELIESPQETDWRQAIIESDIMLDESFTRRGFMGDTLGEKLKNISTNQLKSLGNAWEAHKVRNEIAHQGSAYQLGESLAHRTIAHYEAVFRELGEI